MISESEIEEFRRAVLGHWKSSGRHTLPWRKTKDPYHIFVSEMMLQQTQVPRVLDKYRQFIKKYPKLVDLSRSSIADVVKIWSGLGYNRRAKYLRDAAVYIERNHEGKFPYTYEGLRRLPGVGGYTARAVRVFAFNEPEVLIETNIRAAYLHHFFAKKKGVTDAEILQIAEIAASGQDPRVWHQSLMDYGSHLKKTIPNPSRRSATHKKQSTFKGSLRETRGKILRTLGFSVMNEETLEAELGMPKRRLSQALDGLMKDGLIEKKGEMLRLAL